MLKLKLLSAAIAACLAFSPGIANANAVYEKSTTKVMINEKIDSAGALLVQTAKDISAIGHINLGSAKSATTAGFIEAFADIGASPGSRQTKVLFVMNSSKDFLGVDSGMASAKMRDGQLAASVNSNLMGSMGHGKEEAYATSAAGSLLAMVLQSVEHPLIS